MRGLSRYICIPCFARSLEWVGRKREANHEQVNIFLDDMANFKEMNETYGVYFAHKPARSCVAVKALPLGVPVEIECIALAGKSSSL